MGSEGGGGGGGGGIEIYKLTNDDKDGRKLMSIGKLFGFAYVIYTKKC